MVQRVADERGISLDEACSQLLQEAIAQRFKKGLGRRPAQIYSIKRSH